MYTPVIFYDITMGTLLIIFVATSWYFYKDNCKKFRSLFLKVLNLNFGN